MKIIKVELKPHQAQFLLDEFKKKYTGALEQEIVEAVEKVFKDTRSQDTQMQDNAFPEGFKCYAGQMPE